MKTHHTKTKGDLGVLKAQVSLFEQGYMILTSQTEHAPFDLVAYKDQKFIRIQVKYRSLKKGVMQIEFRNIWSDKNGSHIIPIDKNEVDLYCVYCPDTDKCYWLNPKEFNKSVAIRVLPSKNNQKKGIKLVSDYEKITLR